MAPAFSQMVQEKKKLKKIKSFFFWNFNFEVIPFNKEKAIIYFENSKRYFYTIYF